MEVHPFRFLRNIRRTSEIVSVLIQFGFGDLVDRLNLRGYVNWGKQVVTRSSSDANADTNKSASENHSWTRAKRIRLALESLGPTFIKFGQVISTRPDLIPNDVLQELAKLQENVPPFSEEEAVRSIEKELGGSLETLFQEFSKTPLAAGSLGQVHRATHKNGSLLAIKVRRPHVVENIERDISLMTEMSLLIEKHVPESKMFDPSGLVSHFSRTIRREMNYIREARSMQEFERMFRKDASLYIPKIYPELSTDAVLTMEFVEGIRIDQLDRHSTLKTKRHTLAENSARIFMRQVFDLGVFHGDPHPGNIRYMPDGALCLLDYGMIGRIDEATREQLIDLFMSIATNNIKKGVRLVQTIGKAMRPIEHSLLENDFRDFVENYYNVPLDQLDIGHLLNDFITILRQHAIQCPSDLLLLIRAIVSLEGCVRIVSPEFNIAETLLPYVKKLVKERFHPLRLLRKTYENLSELGRIAHQFPSQINRILKKAEKNELSVTIKHENLDHLITEMDRSGNRIAIGMVLSALIVASALIIRTDAGNTWFSYPLFFASSILGIWLVYGIFRSGRV